MPFSSGTFSRVHDWTSDRDAGIKISASRTDAEFDGIATALTTTMLKDGSQTLTAMIPFTLGLSVPTDKKLQLRDSAIFLNSSADGQADLVADSVIQVTAPTVNIEASTAITLESDAITLGENTDTDIVLTFNANSADGVITWKEDEDYFLLSDDILMNSTEKIQFGDTASFIQQSSDGVLQIDGEATVNVNASTAFTVTTDTATFTSANANDPVVIIKNTTNDAAAARLHFVKDKGAAGADGDDIGTIEFISDDDGQTQTSFAKIVGEVSESANTDEAGKLSFFVAESDGTTTALTAGLVIEGEHATDGEVDVTIGAGSGSTTAINGTTDVSGSLSVSGTANSLTVDKGLLDRSGNITRLVSGRSGGNYASLEVHIAGVSGVNKQLTMDYQGNTTLHNGNLVIGTAGKGIDFSATSDSGGTTNSELLDDYEEGTFTPVLSFGTGTTGIAYSLQTGIYRKIGDVVYIYARITLSNKGSSSGSAAVSSPFTYQNVQTGGGGNGLAFANNISSVDASNISAGPFQNGSSIAIYNNTTGNSLTEGNFTNTTDFILTFIGLS
jgi:hypothetical protein